MKKAVSQLKQPLLLIEGLVKLTLFTLLMGGCASDAPSTLDPEGPAAAQVAFLWWVMFWIATAVCVLVIALLIWALIRTQGRKPEEIDYHPNVGRRFIIAGGIIFPVVVLTALMGLVAYTSQSLAAAAPAEVTVEVIGHQWWWEVRYPEGEVATANEIHIPAGQRVTFQVTTDDVIHSFWIPQLYGKIDLIPGQINIIQLQANEPGVYRGQCAEFCGAQHAKMAFLVITDSPEQFAAWLEQQQQPAPEPIDPLNTSTINVIYDFNGDVFDHSNVVFIGGASLFSCLGEREPVTSAGALPIGGSKTWGQEWKEALRQHWDAFVPVTMQGESLPYADQFLDLDPIYKDIYGLPLLRLTFDWHENDYKMYNFIARRAEEILTQMGPSKVETQLELQPYNIHEYQSTHCTGGAIMGSDPGNSVTNKYGQVWDTPNVFVTGAALYPQNPGANPSETFCALAYMTGDAMRENYFNQPNQLLT